MPTDMIIAIDANTPMSMRAHNEKIAAMSTEDNAAAGFPTMPVEIPGSMTSFPMPSRMQGDLE